MKKNRCDVDEFPIGIYQLVSELYLQDLLGGVIVALIFRIVLYYKAKNARSSGMERSMDQPGGEIGKISNHLKIRYLRTILF